MAEQFDVVVIGAGPAGTLAAARAGERGAKTALVTRGAFGGMSANEGPIPVRTLAYAARLVREARHLSEYGIVGGHAPHLDYERLLARARDVVAEARAHSTLFDKVQQNGVRLFEHAGTARFTDAHTIESANAPALRADRVVVCTGGVSRKIGAPGDELTVTPADAFGLTALPESLLVIGAGATGVQVASIFNALGSRIILAQSGPRIIQTEDADVSDEVVRAFREDGMTVYENAGRIAGFEKTPGGVRATWQSGGPAPVETQYAVAAIGWAADTQTLHLDAAGVALDRRGFIEVDEYLRTSAGHIYAAGDVLGRSMQVPQAVTEGYIAGTNAAGRETIAVERSVEPIGSFTDPEYAHVGLTEQEARESHDVAVARASFEETTRPIIDGRTRGFCKLVIDRGDHTLLGCHIVGERAVEVVQMAAIAMTAGMRVDDLARLPLSFPTYANVFGRAAIHAARELGAKRVVHLEG